MTVYKDEYNNMVPEYGQRQQQIVSADSADMLNGIQVDLEQGESLKSDLSEVSFDLIGDMDSPSEEVRVNGIRQFYNYIHAVLFGGTITLRVS